MQSKYTHVTSERPSKNVQWNHYFYFNFIKNRFLAVKYWDIHDIQDVHFVVIEIKFTQRLYFFRAIFINLL